MKLVPMTQAEFDRWTPRSQSEYAKSKMKANGYTQQEADEIARRDFGQLLPDGLGSKDHFLFTMKNESNMNVGHLWLAVRGAADNRKAFIFDIIVEEKYRGQGFGRGAMLAAEAEVKKLGLSDIGLHVFGYNEPAIRLYKSLGYQTTDLVMAKKI